MFRKLPWIVAVLMVTNSVFSADPVKTVKVEGQLIGLLNVAAECTVSNTGAIAGTGKLSGKNRDGSTFSYPFKIERFSTAKGKLILYGHFTEANGGAVSINASVPGGPLVFTYFAGGSNHSVNGKGTVTVQ